MAAVGLNSQLSTVYKLTSVRAFMGSNSQLADYHKMTLDVLIVIIDKPESKFQVPIESQYPKSDANWESLNLDFAV